MSVRRSMLTKRLTRSICDRVAEGESLAAICAEQRMPGYSTVRGWLARAAKDGAPAELVAFRESYQRAREWYADYLADEALDLVRTVTSENAREVRRRFEVIKRKTARLAPQVYGDQVTVG